ncbi:hypothetical protein WR25_04934 [Diploscapter pachys]|uniref:Hemimethylated DNA-binding domain-containing protein n=1 Tax=Diploscapter pachys TaxID=2018661 RepID=A0A2A2JQR2_9BILA|nr:hypothetical protein WR25_04934 [Diploscapter pachys]
MSASPILLRFTTGGQLNNLRGISTSVKNNARFRISPPPSFREIGRIMPTQKGANSEYQPGQFFIHRTFAYRGVIICGFNTRYHEKDTNKNGSVTQDSPTSKTKQYYQVLIHRPDWPFLGFPVDMTSYLVDNGPPTPTGRTEKILTVINGMDCVSQDDVLPYAPLEETALEHDLFDRIFELKLKNGLVVAGIKPELIDNYRHSNRTWLAPRDVFTQVTDNIEVTVTTFYLGENLVNGQTKHVWRYVVRSTRFFHKIG